MTNITANKARGPSDTDKKLKRGDLVWFIAYGTYEIIKAEVTGKTDTVVALRGLSEGHEDERFVRHINELATTEETALEAKSKAMQVMAQFNTMEG